MSLYQDGTQITIPFATVVPGVIDPTLTKLKDVAIPGGRRINMQDYAAISTEPVLERQQVGTQIQEKPLMKLGDGLHFDLDKDQAKHAPIKPKIQDIDTIPQTKTIRDWRGGF